MCIRFNRIILLIITFLSASMFVEARDLSPYKKTCKEIGFKAGTEKFGKCVVKLIKRDKANNKTLEAEKENNKKLIEDIGKNNKKKQLQIEELNKEKLN